MNEKSRAQYNYLYVFAMNINKGLFMAKSLYTQKGQLIPANISYQQIWNNNYLCVDKLICLENE